MYIFALRCHSMKISIVGGGYVGLVTGSCFAQLGHDVTIIEVDPAKVQSVNNGKTPIYENGLEDLLKEKIKDPKFIPLKSVLLLQDFNSMMLYNIFARMMRIAAFEM